MSASMIPLVWDFGQLDANIECVYITQMLKKAIRNAVLTKIDSLEELETISNLLTQSQSFISRNGNGNGKWEWEMGMGNGNGKWEWEMG
ncbi:MAG: hypothetical protein ACK55Z_23670, partial [bacterium]